MKMKMKVLKPKSISEAFEQTVEFIANWDSSGSPYCWFRGVKDNKLKLQPGAYWRNNYSENVPVLTFAQEGVAYVPISDSNSWDTYQLAQHHGVPTRLLDWSESFSAALFFALDMWEAKTTPCIWICRPEKLNHVFIEWEGILAPETSDNLKLWLPRQIANEHSRVETDGDGYRYDNDWPLAIYPKKSNKRIAAQQGTFTVHGRRTESLEALFVEKNGVLNEAFARVDLVFKDKLEALAQLKLLGVRRSTIYPDIDNLVKQMREELEW